MPCWGGEVAWGWHGEGGGEWRPWFMRGDLKWNLALRWSLVRSKGAVGRGQGRERDSCMRGEVAEAGAAGDALLPLSCFPPPRPDPGRERLAGTLGRRGALGFGGLGGGSGLTLSEPSLLPRETGLRLLFAPAWGWAANASACPAVPGARAGRDPLVCDLDTHCGCPHSAHPLQLPCLGGVERRAAARRLRRTV